LTQYISIEDRRRAKGLLAGDLPEDVLGLCAAAQSNNGTVAHGKSLRYLEDPDIICPVVRLTILATWQKHGTSFF